MARELDPLDGDRRDLELGAALKDWVAVDPHSVEALGPFETSGLDPIWVLRFRSDKFEADACLFRGAYVDVSASELSSSRGRYLVGGEEDLTVARLTAILRDLHGASWGSPTPLWLRQAVD